jgi:CheY-like chemotaxis protein
MFEKRRLLLVDDDPDATWCIGRFLARHGWTVSTCGDGVEAIALLEEEDFDAVITDVQMPRLNGLGVVDWVRRSRPRLAIVVITAFGSPSVRKTCLRKGAFHYLEKPVDPNLLIDLLNTPEDRESFSGSMTGVDLFDYVQMLLVSRKSVVVEMRSRTGREGKIYIEDGNIVHAECGGSVGERAFLHCLSFQGGSFTSIPWSEPPDRTIERRGEFLLLDAAREKDETTQIRVPTNSEPRISELPDDVDLSFDLMPSIIPPPPGSDSNERN